jgi:hypothetical protein
MSGRGTEELLDDRADRLGIDVVALTLEDQRTPRAGRSRQNVCGLDHERRGRLTDDRKERRRGGRTWLGRGRDGHQLGRRVRPVPGDHLSGWRPPRRCASPWVQPLVRGGHASAFLPRPESEAGGRVGVVRGSTTSPRRSLTGGAHSSSRLAAMTPYPLVPVTNRTTGAWVHPGSVRPQAATVPPDRGRASSPAKQDIKPVSSPTWPPSTAHDRSEQTRGRGV